MATSQEKDGIQSINTIAEGEIPNPADTFKKPIYTDEGEITYLETMREKDPFARYILAQSKLAIESYLKELSPQEKTKFAVYLGEPVFAEPEKAIMAEQIPGGNRYSIVRDRDVWNVYTNTGRILEVRVDSLEQLDADLRGAYEAVDFNKLRPIIEHIDEFCTSSKQEEWEKLTPHERAALHALHNTKQVLSPAEWDLLKRKIQRGNLSMYILPEEDYETFNKGFNCNKNHEALTLSNPPQIKGGINDNRVIVRIPYPEDRVIIICREIPKYTPKIIARTSYPTILINLERMMTHELLHSAGIAKHLPRPMEEGVVEYLNILAYKRGEALRKETRDELAIGYPRIVGIIEILYSKLREIEVPEEALINFMKFGGNQEESEIVYNGLVQLFGKDNLNRLLRWEFEDDEEAYEWVKEKLL